MARRFKVGLIVPSANTTIERDFALAFPKGRDVSFHSARMWNTHGIVEDIDGMNAEAETAARQLGSAGVDVLVYGCTSGSFLGGVGADVRLTRRLSEAAGGTPTVTTSTAILQAVRHLGVRRLSVITPYVDELNEPLADFLVGNEVTVVNLVGHQISESRAVGAQVPDTVAAFAIKHASPAADGVLLACTNWRALEAVYQVEAKTQLPVIASNQACVWACYRELGIDDRIGGYGRLLADPAANTLAQA